jgi:hypothetical protein
MELDARLDAAAHQAPDRVECDAHHPWIDTWCIL